MYSKFYPYDEQRWNIQCEKGVQSRVIAYSPEIMMMEWRFFKEGYIVPMHAHYHAQISYLARGSAKVTLADGNIKHCKSGDAVSFAPNEAHSVVIAEPDTVIIDIFAPVRLDHLENHCLIPDESRPTYEASP